MVDIAAPDIPGSDEIVRWFGYWPSFHDAEVLEVHLDRTGSSSINLLTWRTTNEVDENNCYKQERHARVTFLFERILALELEGFSPQNVIFGLILGAKNDRWRLVLERCYGIGGFIEAKDMRVTLDPIDQEGLLQLKNYFRSLTKATDEKTNEHLDQSKRRHGGT